MGFFDPFGMTKAETTRGLFAVKVQLLLISSISSFFARETIAKSPPLAGWRSGGLQASPCDRVEEWPAA